MMEPCEEYYLMVEEGDNRVLVKKKKISLIIFISYQAFSQRFIWTFQALLEHCRDEFLKAAVICPAVVCCRCSPEQKANIVQQVAKYTKVSVAAIG